jgi:hypothetical protein
VVRGYLGAIGGGMLHPKDYAMKVIPFHHKVYEEGGRAISGFYKDSRKIENTVSDFKAGHSNPTKSEIDDLERQMVVIKSVKKALATYRKLTPDQLNTDESELLIRDMFIAIQEIDGDAGDSFKSSFKSSSGDDPLTDRYSYDVKYFGSINRSDEGIQRAKEKFGDKLKVK